MGFFSSRFPHPASSRLFLVALAAAGLFCVAGAHRQDPKIFVRFHVETNELDQTFATPVQLLSPRRTIYVEKMPSISEKEIVSFYPYRAPDNTFGAAFQLDRHGQLTLQNLSVQKRGKSLVATCNGRIITPLAIDKIITDGVIYVPFGLTEQEIRALGESYRLTNPENLRNKSVRDPDSNPLAPAAPSPGTRP